MIGSLGVLRVEVRARRVGGLEWNSDDERCWKVTGAGCKEAAAAIADGGGRWCWGVTTSELCEIWLKGFGRESVSMALV